jgi:hypothetical protein
LSVALKAASARDDQRHQLYGCEGFRVAGADGHVGVVVAVLAGTAALRSPEPPGMLLVRTGPFRRRELHVPLGQVRLVDHAHRRVLLWQRAKPSPLRVPGSSAAGVAL